MAQFQDFDLKFNRPNAFIIHFKHEWNQRSKESFFAVLS